MLSPSFFTAKPAVLTRTWAAVFMLLVLAFAMSQPAHAADLIPAGTYVSPGQMAPNAPSFTKEDMPSWIVKSFFHAIGLWETVITKAALHLFFAIAVIDMVTMAGGLILKNVALEELLANFIRRLLFISLFLMLLHSGPAICLVIFDSFQTLAAKAGAYATPISQSVNGGQSAAPVATDIIALILDCLSHLWDSFTNFSWKSLLLAVPMALTGVIVAACGTLIAVAVVWQTIKFYVQAYAGILLLGFGGSSWTQHMAVQYFKAAFFDAFKWFVTILLATTTLGIVKIIFSDQLIYEKSTTLLGNEVTYISLPGMATGMIVMLFGACLVVAAPLLAQSLISPGHGGGSGLMGVVSVTGKVTAGAASAASATAGAGMAAGAAWKAAGATGVVGAVTGALPGATPGGGAESGAAGLSRGAAMMAGLGAIASRASAAAGILAQGAMQEQGSQLRGESSSKQGTTGGRIAKSIDNASNKKTADAAAGNSSPFKPPSMADRLASMTPA